MSTILGAACPSHKGGGDAERFGMERTSLAAWTILYGNGPINRFVQVSERFHTMDSLCGRFCRFKGEQRLQLCLVFKMFPCPRMGGKEDWYFSRHPRNRADETF